MQRESLLAIKNILFDFSVFSGLCCNYDKTVILPVLPPTQEEEEMLVNLGFTCVKKLKLLGLDITNN
jgi:hypothetical protein